MSKTPDPFQLLLDGIADYAIFLLDQDGRINKWSTSAQKIFGYQADEIQGRHVSVLSRSSEGDSAVTNGELEMAAAHGRFEDVGWRFRKDQTQFWADCVICPIRDDQGHLQGFSLLVRDITERKKAAEA